MRAIVWISAAAVSAYACHLAVEHATPVDRALPLIAVAVTLLASVSYPSVMIAVPMLIAAEIAIFDEVSRLLAFGAIAAACTWVALMKPRRAGDVSSGREELAVGSVVVAVAAVVLLRWIPLSSVLVARELFLLATVALIVLVLGRTPFAVAVGIGAALVTPAIPLRTLALPVAVLAIAVLARLFGMPRLSLAWPSSVSAGFILLFFPWSGVIARGAPYAIRHAEPRERVVVGQALEPGAATLLHVPDGAVSLVVSGANVAHLPRGTVLGRIEPGARDVRIGDAADWGYMRRSYFHGSRNPLPDDPAGTIRDYGYEAWVDGGGRVPLPRGARLIRVTAARSLPPGAALQVEGFEKAR